MIFPKKCNMYSTLLMFLLVLLMMKSIRLAGLDDMDLPNMQNWIDPDSVQFGQVSETSRTEQGKTVANRIFMQELQQPQTSVKCLAKQANCDGKVKSVQQYLRRFVNLLLRAVDLEQVNEDMEHHMSKSLKVELTNEQLQTLRDFGAGAEKISLRKIDEILTAVVSPSSSFVPQSYFSAKWTEFLQNPQLILGLKMCALLGISFMVFRYWTLAQVLFFILLASLGMTYYITYNSMTKEAEIQRHIELRKHAGVSADCSPKAYIWGGDCEAAMRVHLKDAPAEVTPVDVMSKIFSGLLADQFSNLGEGLSAFYKQLGELPFLYRLYVTPVASVILVVVITVLLVALSGGTIRLPYFLGSASFRSQNQTSTETPPVASCTNQEVLTSGAVSAQPIQFHITLNNPQPLHRSHSSPSSRANEIGYKRNSVDMLDVQPESVENMLCTETLAGPTTLRRITQSSRPHHPSRKRSRIDTSATHFNFTPGLQIPKQSSCAENMPVFRFSGTENLLPANQDSCGGGGDTWTANLKSS